MTLNDHKLNFFGWESISTDESQLRGSESKFENIKEQNQNWPNLKGVECISVLKVIIIMDTIKDE